MKNIPIALRAHLAQNITTWCYLLRIECSELWNHRTIGFTSLDEQIIYDDGFGPLVYHPENGAMPHSFVTASDFGVDTTELVGWSTDHHLSHHDIMAGMFDFASVTLYRVNFMDLHQGHEVIAHGTLGETQVNDTKWSVELRSLKQQLKQPICTVYSLTCRAQFGDARCGLPIIDWVEGVVSAVSQEPRRVFIADALPQNEGYFTGGVLQWITGNNTGAHIEVDTFTASKQISSSFEFAYPVAIGDRFRIRQDCDKTFATCKVRNNVLNFRGEHLTPVADTALQTPGANIKSIGSH